MVGAAVAVLVVPLLVVVLVALVQEQVKDCFPDATGTDGTGLPGPGGDISEPVEGQLTMAQANIPTRSGTSGFNRSMPRVLSSHPDFVSLNEQPSRSVRMMESAAPGYEAFRDPKARGQAASTAIMWDAARWRRTDAGRTLLVPRGPQEWDAGRSATWVTVKGAGGAVVSAVSVHHMVNPGKWGPNLPLRQQIYGQGMDRLVGLVKALEARGPVFIAGDMNTHVDQRRFAWSAAAKMARAGYGWANDSVDFIFYPRTQGVRPIGRWSGSMVSDHDWVAARFEMNGATAGGTTRRRGARAARSSAAPASQVVSAAAAKTTVAGLDAEQTRNATTIVEVASELGVSERGAVVALAAALQESGLRNLDYGDRDSLGLFQQRPSSGWGTPAQIRDPEAATRAFFGRAEHTDNTGLLDVPGWEQMSVTVAAQAVQRSGYPEAYADDEDLARKILAQLDPTVAQITTDATTPSYCPDNGTGATPISAAGCGPTGSPAEAGLTPDALLVLRCVAGRFGPHTFGGVGERAANPGSDHPAGKAVDVMIEDYSSAEGIAEGDAIAAWLQDRHEAFGITYLIWRDRIWSPGDAGWRPYSHPSGATDPTSLHMDHVHVSVAGNAGTGITPVNTTAVGGTAMPLPAGTYVDQHNWHDGGGAGSHWANWHTGNDLSAACGTPVLAVTAGTVVIDTAQSWAGPQLVKITQGPGNPATWYAHMSAVTVGAGQQVVAGQQIGAVGNEGNSFGCHLHLELHLQSGSDIYGADNTDPMPWIRAHLN